MLDCILQRGAKYMHYILQHRRLILGNFVSFLWSVIEFIFWVWVTIIWGFVGVISVILITSVLMDALQNIKW